MKSMTEQIELFGDDKEDGTKGDMTFKGHVTVNVPLRAERLKMQHAVRGFTSEDKNGTSVIDIPKYSVWSEKILKENLLSLEVECCKTGDKITTKEELEYFDSELLIGTICHFVSNGKVLGKPTGQQ